MVDANDIDLNGRLAGIEQRLASLERQVRACVVTPRQLAGIEQRLASLERIIRYGGQPKQQARTPEQERADRDLKDLIGRATRLEDLADGG